MIWDEKAYDDVILNYRKGKAWLSDVTVEIEGGPAEAEPLALLRIYDQQPTVDTNNMLAAMFCKKKKVIFRRNDEVIFFFMFNGDDLAANFKDCPWLLDVLHQAAYATLLKKVTPPSIDSENEETR